MAAELSLPGSSAGAISGEFVIPLADVDGDDETPGPPAEGVMSDAIGAPMGVPESGAEAVPVVGDGAPVGDMDVDPGDATGAVAGVMAPDGVGGVVVAEGDMAPFPAGDAAGVMAPVDGVVGVVEGAMEPFPAGVAVGVDAAGVMAPGVLGVEDLGAGAAGGVVVDPGEGAAGEVDGVDLGAGAVGVLVGGGALGLAAVMANFWPAEQWPESVLM